MGSFFNLIEIEDEEELDACTATDCWGKADVVFAEDEVGGGESSFIDKGVIICDNNLVFCSRVSFCDS